jgi:hypothetical protein
MTKVIFSVSPVYSTIGNSVTRLHAGRLIRAELKHNGFKAETFSNSKKEAEVIRRNIERATGIAMRVDERVSLFA